MAVFLRLRSGPSSLRFIRTSFCERTLIRRIQRTSSASSIIARIPHNLNGIVYFEPSRHYCLNTSRFYSQGLIDHSPSTTGVDEGKQTNSNTVCSTVPPETESNPPASLAYHTIKLNCNGCGAVLQTRDPQYKGFIVKEKLDEWLAFVENNKKEATATISNTSNMKADVESDSNDSIAPSGTDDISADDESAEQDDSIKDFFVDSVDAVEEDKKTDLSSLVCKRCFSLKHYSTALNISLESGDYLRHLSQLRDKRALLLLMIDVTDFPGCVFPNLDSLMSPSSTVLIVANKVDLLPRGLQNRFWLKFKDMIIEECRDSSLGDCRIAGVRFVSAWTGKGIEELSYEIVKYWGNRGDVYLLGCTNVGKSSLFNRLLTLLCGAKPGELNTESNIRVPMATISNWPGTTLGLLSFPIMSVKKRLRLQEQKRRMEEKMVMNTADVEENVEGDAFEDSIQFNEEEILNPKEAKQASNALLNSTEVEEVLKEIGLHRKTRQLPSDHDQPPQNRFWLYDTPGAINDAQLINLLTNKELKLSLPKRPLKPRTIILKPGQCFFLGGLARLDYIRGPVSAYFTVFANNYLPVHTTQIHKADSVYERNLGNSMLKIPIDDGDRLEHFPALDCQDITIEGISWTESAADIVLSSAGWVSVTLGIGKAATLKAYTPQGKGISLRSPALLPSAVNIKGKRSQKGNRTKFQGLTNKKQHYRSISTQSIFHVAKL